MTLLLIGVVCWNVSCVGKPKYQTISHIPLCGKTDYIHFITADTGYIITHIGELYDSIHSSYVYQTTDGGVYWEIVDSIPHYSFSKYSHTTYRDIVYCYMDDGKLSDNHWNSYFCFIDLKNHRHKVIDDAVYGPGKIFYNNDSIHFPAYKEKSRYIFRSGMELNEMICASNTLPKHVKDIAYTESVLALITYNNMVYVLQSDQMSNHNIGFPCDGIVFSGNDCYITYWGNNEYDGGMIRYDCMLHRIAKMDYPSGYQTVEFIKTSNDSVIITCTQKDHCSLSDDIVYSIDKGRTWKKIHLCDPIVFPEISSYNAPYLYIKSTFANEIYKLKIE